MLTLLLAFTERNPGITRILTGDALAGETERLHARVAQLFDRFETQLKQVLREAEMREGIRPVLTINAAANLLLALPPRAAFPSTCAAASSARPPRTWRRAVATIDGDFLPPGPVQLRPARARNRRTRYRGRHPAVVCATDPAGRRPCARSRDLKAAQPIRVGTRLVWLWLSRQPDVGAGIDRRISDNVEQQGKAVDIALKALATTSISRMRSSMERSVSANLAAGRRWQPPGRRNLTTLPALDIRGPLLVALYLGSSGCARCCAGC